MNPKKKSRRCRGHGLDSGLDLAISRFIYSFGGRLPDMSDIQAVRGRLPDMSDIQAVRGRLPDMSDI